MKMHHTKKTKYTKMKLEQGVTREEMLPVLLHDDISEADAKEFLDELYNEGVSAIVGDTKGPEIVPDREIPVKKEAEANFDYGQLVGDSFEKYCKHHDSLDLFTERDYQQFKVDVVMVERYPGMHGTPVDMKGINITNTKPINTTRISPKVANDLNSQVRNTGRYFLLKQ